MNDNLDIWIVGFYRDSGTEPSQAGTDNINPDKSHQPNKKELSPPIYSFFSPETVFIGRKVLFFPYISFALPFFSYSNILMCTLSSMSITAPSVRFPMLQFTTVVCPILVIPGSSWIWAQRTNRGI
jgi:hypothetical protein